MLHVQRLSPCLQDPCHQLAWTLDSAIMQSHTALDAAAKQAAPAKKVSPSLGLPWAGDNSRVQLGSRVLCWLEARAGAARTRLSAAAVLRFCLRSPCCNACCRAAMLLLPGTL